ncbi:MAG TPA: PQQ-binding-like beta-propeller repeat protein, partial [Ktedonobacteraceae bacterium]
MDDYNGQEGRRKRSQNSVLLLLILGGMLAGFLIIASPTLSGWLHFIADHSTPTITSRSLPSRTHPTALPTPSASASTTSASYTMFGLNPQHTNDDTDETQLSPSTVSHLTLAWSYHIGGPLQGAPIISDGNVYIAAQNLAVLHVTDGSLSWSTTGENGGGQNSPAVVNGIVYFVPSGGGVLYALSATTRAELWAVSAGNYIFSSPTIADGNV